MLAFASENDGADVRRQRGEKRLDAADGRVVERVAFFRARQLQHGDIPAPLGLERRRQISEIGYRSGSGHDDPAITAPFDPVRRAP